MSEAPKIVIVGGGVFGCSTAYELAKAGASVTLIERDAFGAHASGKNPGNLNPILATPHRLVPFALASFNLHLTLAAELAELGCPSYRLEDVRRLMLAFDNQDIQELKTIEALFVDRAGFSATPLNAADIGKVDRRLSSEVEAGLLLTGNKSVDSRMFNHSLAEATRKLGVRQVRANVLGLTHRQGNVRTAHTSEGNFDCDGLVLASGPWISDAKDWLGLDLPITPVKGEMLRIELPGAEITHDFTQGQISLYRRGEDEVWIGVTKEQAGFDESATSEGKRQLLDGARRIMPAIAEARTVEHLASLRPMSASGMPIVSKAPGWNNVYLGNGGGVKGILLCAGIGRAIRDLVLTGTSALPIDSFGL